MNSATLKVGSIGPEVGNWQLFLAELDMRDTNGKAIVPDEHFGAKTESATRRWQGIAGLPMNGVVDLEARVLAYALGFIPFVQAKNFTRVTQPARAIDVLVIHTMENDEKGEQAENVALWFAGRTAYAAPKASAHYCIDHNSVVQCVRDGDVAWHAPGANHNGIGLELAGRARQTPAQWADEDSRAVLTRAALLSAKLCRRYAIPIVTLLPEQVKTGERGICGHFTVTSAFKTRGGHTDPGVSFPWDAFINEVQIAYDGLP